MSAIHGRRDANRVSEDRCEMLLIAEPHFQSDVENGEVGICKQFLTSLDAEPEACIGGGSGLCLHETEMRNGINSTPHS